MLKRTLLPLMMALLLTMPTYAKQKVSKEAREQAAQMDKAGWKLTSEMTATMAELLDVSIQHRSEMIPGQNIPRYIVVNATATASTQEKAHKMALLKARKDIMTMKEADVSNETDNMTSSSNVSHNDRMVSSSSIKSSMKQQPDNVLMSAYRQTDKGTEVMIILESKVLN